MPSRKRWPRPGPTCAIMPPTETPRRTRPATWMLFSVTCRIFAPTFRKLFHLSSQVSRNAGMMIPFFGLSRSRRASSLWDAKGKVDQGCPCHLKQPECLTLEIVPV